MSRVQIVSDMRLAGDIKKGVVLQNRAVMVSEATKKWILVDNKPAL